MARETPKNVDGYPVVKELGEGASGVVYQVRLPGRQRYAALKLFTGNLDAGQILTFKREFGAIARCRHSGIVSVYGLGEHEGRPYILMEFLRGEPLDRAVRKGLRPMEPLPADRRETLTDAMLRILDTLKYLHGQRIVHRDIKPANLVMTEEGEVKLLDFGMAWTRSGREVDRQGGTAGYQAPEMLMGKPVDPRSDLYALGVCLYEIISGVNPFGNVSGWNDLIDRQMNERYNRLGLMNPAYGEKWEFFTKRLMNANPIDRYHSASQAMHDLMRLASVVTADTAETSPDARSWGLMESEWVGDPSGFEGVLKNLQDGNHVRFDAPHGAGRTRWLQECRDRANGFSTVIWTDGMTDSLRNWVTRFLDELVKINPDIAETHNSEGAYVQSYLGSGHVLSGESPERSRDRFINTVARIARTGQDTEKNLLIFDNIEHLDAISLRLITSMTGIPSITILAAGGPVDDVLGSAFETVSWSPASTEDLAALIDRRLGGENTAAPEVTERILHLAEHRLGKASAFLTCWHQDGQLRIRDNQWFLSPPAVRAELSLQNPELAAQILKGPTGRRNLPEEDRLDREILRLIAACDESVSFSLIAKIFAAREILILEVLDRLIRTGWLIEETGRSAVEYRFSDASVKKHVYESMSPFHQRYLHRRIAETLQRCETDDIAEYASHICRSDNAQTGFDELDRVASAARDRYENDTALRWYDCLLDRIAHVQRDSVDVIMGPEDWQIRFDGATHATMIESARNHRKLEADALNRKRLEIFRSRGNIYGRTGDYGAAFDAFQHMLAGARDAGDTKLQGDALRFIGQILFYQRKLKESEKYFKDSLAIRTSDNDREGIADCLNALGVLAQQSDALDEALDYFSRSLEIKMELNDEKGLVYIKNNIANIYYSKGLLKEALEEFKDSATVFRKMDDLLGLAYCLYNIGGVAIELGLYSEAVEVLEEAVSIRRKMQDLQDLGHSLWQLASAYQGSGRRGRARECLIEAAEVLEKVNLTEDAEECRQMLAQMNAD
ncbi:MAG TPA: protein kinase [bacterium]|nr:protein kinase [bacterium]